MSSELLFDQESHLGIITLNRPQALNALNLPMVRALQLQLDAWAVDPMIHAVVIQSACGKAFCAGGDVRWLVEAGLRGDSEARAFFEEEYHLNHTIHHYKKPYIALMNGMTMGGGVGISLHGSHPIASETFVFSMPETSIGFFPDIGASALLMRCPGSMGLYLGLTGERLNACEAHALGLVKFVMNASSFDSVLRALKKTDLSNEAHAKVTACLQQWSTSTEPSCLHPLIDDVAEFFNQPTLESIIQRLHEAGGAWHQMTVTKLLQKSPLSLNVTFSQLKKAEHLTFDECLQMDAQLVGHFMKGHDFYEGVRALLIDKDKSPKWQPPTLTEVKASEVASYFMTSRQ